jgi:diacylglycerol O-acyltransferase
MGSKYERLNAIDEAFFSIEQKNAPMHLASILVFEAGELRQPDGGVNATAIRAHIASTLHRVPRYRQKIAWIPFAGRPVWVDDRRFDLDHHVRHTSLPRPGNDGQLKRLSAHIMEQPLDRDRPLWQLHIVEGMEGGRFALIAKVHHCMVDGVSGIDLLKVLLNPLPGVDSTDPPRFTPRPSPGGFELYRDEMLRRIARRVKALRDLGSFLAHPVDAPQSVRSRVAALSKLLEGMFRRPSPAPFNRPISAQRRIDWLTMALEPIEGIRRSLGGSLNDVVLSVVSGALRRYLTRRKVRVSAMTFRAMTPISLRAEHQHGALGNKVSAWIVDLPVSEPSPRERLRRIHRATQELKASTQPVGATVVTEMSEWTYSPLLVSLTAKHLTRLLPCNLVVTNIPGPQFPVYMLSATMCEAFPLVPLTDGLGLNVAVMSYDGKLCWGFNADYDLVPDLDVFVRAMKEAFQELCTLSLPARPPKPPLKLSPRT